MRVARLICCLFAFSSGSTHPLVPKHMDFFGRSPFGRDVFGYDPISDVLGEFSDFWSPFPSVRPYSTPSLGWYGAPSGGFGYGPDYGVSQALTAPRRDFGAGGRQLATTGGGRGGGMSSIINDRHQFAVNLDVHQFRPEEITVKTAGDYVTVEGRHEEREDPHGYIKRHFVRKYMLPENVKPENVTSTLSSDGVLTIKAPKEHKALEHGGEREIPIKQVPFPAVGMRGAGQQQQLQQGQQPEQGQEGQQGGQQGQQAGLEKRGQK